LQRAAAMRSQTPTGGIEMQRPPIPLDLRHATHPQRPHA